VAEKLHAFLISVLYGDEWLASCLDRVTTEERNLKSFSIPNFIQNGVVSCGLKERVVLELRSIKCDSCDFIAGLPKH
jgi:hypothetical protein